MGYDEKLLIRDGSEWAELDPGPGLPFENTTALGKWLRKRQLLASPDGYDVLDAFLGKRQPAPIVDPGATYTTSFSPAHAAELRTIAERSSVTVSAALETCWRAAERVRLVQAA